MKRHTWCRGKARSVDRVELKAVVTARVDRGRMDAGVQPATTASTRRRRVRENAPLQNRFCERDRAGWSRIERERLDGHMRRRQKNFRTVILAAHQLLRYGRDAL